jgi:catechol 2,3-dioxygenase-like lactoylglutathione lyase family enzyme
MTGLVEGVGHIIIPVEDMDLALRFYRDLLGFLIKGEVDPVWTELDAGGFPLTLFRSGESSRVATGPDANDTPLVFHVSNYDVAEQTLTESGVRFRREGRHQGVVWDPFGNVLRLHDHRK